MGSIHNDLHTWAYRARKQGRTTIEIDVETADRACEKIVELSNRVLDLEHALRAQPPAREDAQPVAWRYRTAPHRAWFLTESSTDAEYEGADGSEVQPLYTHPAPDALRQGEK